MKNIIDLERKKADRLLEELIELNSKAKNIVHQFETQRSDNIVFFPRSRGTS